MSRSDPGVSVPRVTLAHPDDGWYRWRARNPQLATDPPSVWAAAVRHGRRSMLSDSARWVALEPMLAEVLYELRLARLEHDDLDEEPDVDDEPPPDYGPPGTGAVITEYPYEDLPF